MSYYSQYFPYTVLPVFLAGFYFFIEKNLTKPWKRWTWWIICVCILFFAGWYAAQNPSWYDFYKGYYHAGRKIINKPELLYDEACYGYVNFPLLAYLFAPLGKLPKELAGTLFFIMGYVLIMPLAYWLVKFSGLRDAKRWLILFFLAISGPLDYSIWLGNTSHIIMLLILVAMWLFIKDWHWLSGTLLGITGLIKIPLILPAGYFFIQRKWRLVGGGFFIFLVILLLSLLLIPISMNNLWLDRCILAMGGHPVAAYNNQSVAGFLAREFMPGETGWDLLAPTAEYKVVSNIVLALLYTPVLLVLFLGQKIERTKNILLLEFFIVLVCSILTSPISWTHYYVFLLMPVALCIADDSLMPRQAWVITLLGVGLVLASVPVKLTLTMFELTSYRFFLSLHFFGGMILYLFLLLVWINKYRVSGKSTL